MQWWGRRRGAYLLHLASCTVHKQHGSPRLFSLIQVAKLTLQTSALSEIGRGAWLTVSNSRIWLVFSSGLARPTCMKPGVPAQAVASIFRPCRRPDCWLRISPNGLQVVKVDRMDWRVVTNALSHLGTHSPIFTRHQTPLLCCINRSHTGWLGWLTGLALIRADGAASDTGWWRWIWYGLTELSRLYI